MKEKIIVVGMVLTFILFGSVIPFKKVSYSMCSISGSKKYVHNYFLFKTVEEIKSPLEKWIINNLDKNFRPRYKGYGYNIIYLQGRSIGCGTPPNIYSIAYYLDGIIKSSTNTEISNLVKTLTNGSVDAIGKALEEASERYHDYLDEINNE